MTRKNGITSEKLLELHKNNLRDNYRFLNVEVQTRGQQSENHKIRVSDTFFGMSERLLVFKNINITPKSQGLTLVSLTRENSEICQISDFPTNCPLGLTYKVIFYQLVDL